MEMIRENYKLLTKLIAVMAIALVALIIGEVIFLESFNSKVHTQVGPNSDSSVSMTVGEREDGTSSWQKRGYILDGKDVDLNAQTIDGTLVNDSGYNLQKWGMRVNIGSDCFLNNAWCGTVEIHQNVLTRERVQRIDLRNYRQGDITLDYLFDGDLLIPLYAGDYFIYYPSIKDQELHLQSNSQLTIGFIIYYLDAPDLSDYEFTYSFDRKFYNGHQFYIMMTLSVLWLLLFFAASVSYVTFRTAAKEMEIKKSGILSMSDIYSVIYIVDLLKNEINALVEDEETEKIRLKQLTADEQLKRFFEYDSEPAYRAMAVDMCNIHNIKAKLENKSTFAFEYVSKTFGWRRVRFFLMQENDSRKLEKVVFTIQNVNEEKAGIEAIQKRIDSVEHENRVKSNFLANMTQEIRTPIDTIIEFDNMIFEETTDSEVKSYAKNISSAASMLLSLVDGILDVSKMEDEKLELVVGEYSFKKLLWDVAKMVKARAEFDRLEFICDISPTIADRLIGDYVRLKQVIFTLIVNATKYTESGHVKLSIFGKEHDGLMHLLVSVKDTGSGIQAEELRRVEKMFDRSGQKKSHKIEETDIGLNLVLGILDLMDSELHVISKFGEGCELYFELEQKIEDPTTIGQIDLAGYLTDDNV